MRLINLAVITIRSNPIMALSSSVRQNKTMNSTHWPITSRGHIALPSPFTLQDGGRLENAQVYFESYGTLNDARDNAILVFTGLSASAHARSHEQDPKAGWWEAMIGPNQALDTNRFYVLVVNSLGSCFGSTGPGSTNPATQLAYGFDFPTLRLEDIARASQAAVDSLGIRSLHATIGMSLGGMTVLAHAALFPQASRSLISISGALQATTYAVATRSLQREMIGSALKSLNPGTNLTQAVKWARKIGILSYIGADLLEKRFHRDENEPYSGSHSGTDFEVEGWLEHLAVRFSETFNPYAYWTLSRAMDLFSFKDLQRKLGTHFAINAQRALVIGVEEDHLFPISGQHEVYAALTDLGVTTQFERLHSPYGHDAFLTERGLFEPILTRFLNPR